jgi:hypothetical protein
VLLTNENVQVLDSMEKRLHELRDRILAGSGGIEVYRDSGHNTAVRRFRTIWVLTLMALLVSAVAPQASASWQCEGRTCGTTLWFCCCLSPDAPKDANCGSAGTTAEGSGTAACPSDCNCVLTVEAPDDARFVSPVGLAAPVFHPVLLPQAPVLLGPMPTEIVARSIDTRGPPRTPICLATPVLRGPPALMSSTIGS